MLRYGKGLFVVLLVAFFLSMGVSSGRVIRYSFVLSRNGLRAPRWTSEEKKDIFGESWIGPSELTDVGKRQQYLLGYYHNLRYVTETEREKDNKLLSKIYDPREIQIFSLENNRTLQSANSQMFGLYQKSQNLTEKQIERAVPPNNRSLFDEELKKLEKNTLPQGAMVVPVHTFYEDDHTFALQKQENCPKLKNYYNKKYKSTPIKELLGEGYQKYAKKLLPLLKGISEDELKNDPKTLDIITDTFISQFYDDRSMEKFTQQGIDIEEFLTFSKKFQKSLSIGSFQSNGNEELKKEELTIAKNSLVPTFTKILSWMSETINNEKNEHFYSHSYEAPSFVQYIVDKDSLDVMYLFLNSTFDIKGPQRENDFSSNIALELVRKNSTLPISEESYDVEYLYNGELLGSYSYNEFKSKTKSVTQDKKYDDMMKSYCGWKAESFDNYIISTVFLGIVFITIVIFIMQFFFGQKKHEL